MERSQVQVPPVTTGEKKIFFHLAPNLRLKWKNKLGAWLRLGKDKIAGYAWGTGGTSGAHTTMEGHSQSAWLAFRSFCSARPRVPRSSAQGLQPYVVWGWWWFKEGGHIPSGSYLCLSICPSLCVCVLKVFLTRRVAGNVSVAPWVSENEILDFYLLIPIGGTCICVI